SQRDGTAADAIGRPAGAGRTPRLWPADQRDQAGAGGVLRGAPRTAAPGRDAGAGERRGTRRDDARAAPVARAAPPCHLHAARGVSHLGRYGLPGLSQPGCGDRRVQFRAAEYTAAPPGARHVGYLPYDDAGRSTADAYQSGPDPRDARILPRAYPGYSAG